MLLLRLVALVEEEPIEVLLRHFGTLKGLLRVQLEMVFSHQQEGVVWVGHRKVEALVGQQPHMVE